MGAVNSGNGTIRRHEPRGGARLLLGAFSIGMFVFLLIPMLIVVPISFSASPYLEFPPSGWSLRWYEKYFHDPVWIHSTFRSLAIAAATTVISLILSTPLSFAIVRGKMRVLALLERAILAPMVVPHIIIAVAIFNVFGNLHLVGEWYGIALAHTAVAMPFVVIVMVAGLRSFDVNLEHAAVGLGASRLSAIRLVTLPQLLPSMVSAALLAFITSFDELVIAMFLAGPNMTLPKKMFDDIQTEISPTIAAVSAMQVALVLVVMSVVARYGKGAGKEIET